MGLLRCVSSNAYVDTAKYSKNLSTSIRMADAESFKLMVRGHLSQLTRFLTGEALKKAA